MAVNFFSSKGSNETCAIHLKSDNIELMIGNETDEVIQEFFELFYKNIKKVLRNQRRVANLFLTVLIYCTINVIK